jgi:hypothetical protein
VKNLVVAFGWLGIGLVAGLLLCVRSIESKEAFAIEHGQIVIGEHLFKLTEVKP